MKFLLAGIFSIAILAICGCSSFSRGDSTPAQKSSAILILDNNGGYSHPGRELQLFQNGQVIDTRYTDVIGDRRDRFGTYQITENNLTLKFGDRGNETLYKVRFDDTDFWVYSNEVKKIQRKDSEWLRQTSLKTKIQG